MNLVFSLSKQINTALSVAKGKNVLVLHEKTEILEGFFEMNPLFQKTEDKSIGIVGSKLIRGDGSIFYAGIGYALSKFPSTESRIYSWENEIRDRDPKSVPLPYYMYQGHSAFEHQTSSEAIVDGLSSGKNRISN